MELLVLLGGVLFVGALLSAASVWNSLPGIGAWMLIAVGIGTGATVLFAHVGQWLTYTPGRGFFPGLDALFALLSCLPLLAILDREPNPGLMVLAMFLCSMALAIVGLGVEAPLLKGASNSG